MANDDITDEEGADMIIYLEKLKHNDMPKDEALEKWRKMNRYDREVVRLYYISSPDLPQ